MGEYWSRNAYAVAGTGASAVSLPWRPRQLIITNDSTAAGCDITMGGATFSLLPDETLSVEFQPNHISVSGASWRILGFG
jgi:hypothetical protein